jgi:protein SCO1/2
VSLILSALVVLIGLIDPACAGFTERELAGVALQLPPDARIPEDVVFQDATDRSTNFRDALSGHPALVVPVDFTCRATCGPALTIASAALAESGLRPGEEFKLIVIGFDPRDSMAEAHAFTAARIGPVIANATLILQADAANTASFIAAVGYRALYDAGTDQFAHPAGALVATPDGRISRALSSLALNPHDLRLALIEAGEGRIGSIADRVALLCSKFDPVHGIYTSAVTRVLQAACGITVMSLAGVLFWLSRRTRRQRAARCAPIQVLPVRSGRRLG